VIVNRLSLSPTILPVIETENYAPESRKKQETCTADKTEDKRIRV